MEHAARGCFTNSLLMHYRKVSLLNISNADTVKKLHNLSRMVYLDYGGMIELPTSVPKLRFK